VTSPSDFPGVKKPTNGGNYRNRFKQPQNQEEPDNMKGGKK
jgi:hypothetical protein